MLGIQTGNPVWVDPILRMIRIIVYVYFLDNKQHEVPHIHAKYQEHESVVSIPD